MSRVRVVSFDGDDTLWHFDTVLRAALARTLDEIRAVFPDGRADQHTVDHLIAARRAAEPATGVRDLASLRRLGFESTLAELGHEDPALVERLADAFVTHRSSLIEPYPDVMPVLDTLGRDHVIGLITNGNADPEVSVLAGRFSFRVYARDHGVEKPDRALFDAALELAGCEPHELVHVGDSLRCDVAGARAAGVGAVWLNRNDEPVPDGVIAIRSLVELPGIVGSWPG